MVYINNEKAGILSTFIAQGYETACDVKSQAGYVSRKPISSVDYQKQPVYVAGRGPRQGQYFILAPNYISTRYCYRVYLKKVR